MQRLKLLLALIPTLALACDVDDETATRVDDGFVGAGLERAAEVDAIDELADDVDPSLAGYCDSVVAWNADWASFESQVLTLINQRRAAGASCGGVWRPKVPALAKSDKLRCAARRHSKDMGVNDITSHTGSNGDSPWDRIHAAGYSYSTAAENIAWGYSTPQAVVNGWMNSSAHCNNIMSAKVTQIGIGYYKTASSWQHYWTQDFAKPL